MRTPALPGRYISSDVDRWRGSFRGRWLGCVPGLKTHDVCPLPVCILSILYIPVPLCVFCVFAVRILDIGLVSAYNSRMNEPKAPRRRDSVISELSQVLPRLPKYARLVWLLLKDPSLSPKQRTALTAAVGYSISPIDAIPGIIPVIGQLDDLAVVLFTVRWVLSTMPIEKATGYLSGAGLTAEALEDDLNLAMRSGKRILRRLMRIMGPTAVFVWAFGKSLLSRK